MPLVGGEGIPRGIRHSVPGGLWLGVVTVWGGWGPVLRRGRGAALLEAVEGAEGEGGVVRQDAAHDVEEDERVRPPAPGLQKRLAAIANSQTPSETSFW